MTAGVLFSLEGSIGGEVADSREGMSTGADMAGRVMFWLLSQKTGRWVEADISEVVAYADESIECAGRMKVKGGCTQNSNPTL
jgi:hypothetical protein